MENKYKPIKEACKQFPKIDVQPITARVEMPKDNQLYERLMGVVFWGTDIPELANYPKRTKKPL